MNLEIWKDDKLIKRGNDLLDRVRWLNELSYKPSASVLLPITYHEYLSGREYMKLFSNGKCFFGIVTNIQEDKDDEVIRVNLDHVIHEWTYRQISVNNAIKDQTINIVYKGAETDTVNGVSVTASPFAMMLEEVGAFSPSQYIARAGASAWTADGNPQNVKVDSSVKNEAGEYDVTFSSGDASVTVKATVKESKNETERDDYKLTASSFSMKSDEVGKLTDADYIDRANAKVEPEGIIEVDASSIRTTSGTYPVKFTFKYTTTEEGETEEKELTVTVDAIVVGESGSEPTIADDLAAIYSDMNFAYPGWLLNMSSKAKNSNIDYVYSRQNKLDALTKTTELTEDLFWRVRMVNERVVDISEFGQRKQYIFSTKPSGRNNIQIITEPTIEHDFQNVINLASVYSEKSDTGMSSMTLREVYNDPSLQIKGFPVVILRANVNNERDYKAYSTQYPKLAPNNELEYAVIDEESVALEGGFLIEGTYAFNDLSPFNIDSTEGKTEEVTDKDRIEAAVTAYKEVVRLLKLARRRYKIIFEVGELPPDLNVGDRIRFMYDNSIFIMDECTNYEKKILSYDDWFYITRIDTEIGIDDMEVNRLTIEKHIHIERQTNSE